MDMFKVMKVLFVVILGSLFVTQHSIYSAESKLDTVRVSIQSGPLTLAIAKPSFDMNYHEGTHTIVGSLGEIEVTDATGTLLGWKVMVQGTPVLEKTRHGEERILPQGSLLLHKHGATISSNVGELPHIYDKRILPLDYMHPQTLLTAYETEGMGIVNLTFPDESLQLSVPSYEEGNQYIISLNFAIIQGP